MTCEPMRRKQRKQQRSPVAEISSPVTDKLSQDEITSNYIYILWNYYFF